MTSKIEKAVVEAMAEFDAKAEPFAEYEVRRAIIRLRDKDDSSSPPVKWSAEALAFEFHENRRGEESEWGTYFCPMGTWLDKDGCRYETPTIKEITQERLEYWKKRAREVNNPILKARYAGLVWDFFKKVTGQSPPVEMAQMEIDAVVEMATSGIHKYAVEVIRKLGHALKISISTNDTERVEKVRDAIMAYEDKVAEDNKPGLWGFTYDHLWRNKKVSLTAEQEIKIISDLEGRLARVSDTSGKWPLDPFAAEATALRLAQHYRADNRPGDVKRVLLKYGAAFEKAAGSAAALLAQAWLEQVHKVYQDFGMQEDAQRMLQQIRGIGLRAVAELKPISAQIEITREEMDEYVRALMEGDIEIVLSRIAGHYLPRRDEIEKELKDLASKAPLTFLLREQLVDQKGRPIASVGSLEDDLDGRIIKQMSQNMQFSAVFMRQVMTAVISKFKLTDDIITEYVCRSPLFDDDGKPIIKRGITAYLNDDSIEAIHLLIPQVENAIRNLVELTGGTVLKPNRSGGMDLKTFDELLRKEEIRQVLGEDIPLYLRVLLTDRRGVNLRNNVCHGLVPASSFSIGMADRVIHVLLLLAQVKTKQNR